MKFAHKCLTIHSLWCVTRKISFKTFNWYLRNFWQLLETLYICIQEVPGSDLNQVNNILTKLLCLFSDSSSKCRNNTFEISYTCLLQNRYVSSLNTTWSYSGRMKENAWKGHVTFMEVINITKFWPKRLQGKTPTGRLRHKQKKEKMDLREAGCEVYPEFNWFRIGSNSTSK